MSDFDRRIVHLVLIDGSQADAASAADELILGLRPLLDKLLREGRLRSAVLGRRIAVERGHGLSDVEFKSVDDFTHVVELEFGSIEDLEYYYREALHSELRLAFYRRLPGLEPLWGEYEASPPERRHEVFVRIDRRAAELYISRIDYERSTGL